MPQPKIDIPPDQVEAFCRRWKIAELIAFGSVLRDDFRPDSDVDLRVSFAPDAEWSLFDHLAMEEELTELLGRRSIWLAAVASSAARTGSAAARSSS